MTATIAWLTRLPMPFVCDDCEHPTTNVDLVGVTFTRTCPSCGTIFELSPAESDRAYKSREAAAHPLVQRILGQRRTVRELFEHRYDTFPPRAGQEGRAREVAYLREAARLDGMEDAAALTLPPTHLGYLLSMP
jgi:hypothetical protein